MKTGTAPNVWEETRNQPNGEGGGAEAGVQGGGRKKFCESGEDGH